MSRRQDNGHVFWGTVGIMVLIALAIHFWYVSIPLGAAVATFLIDRKRRKARQLKKPAEDDLAGIRRQVEEARERNAREAEHASLRAELERLDREFFERP
jgi:hypothetical protein